MIKTTTIHNTTSANMLGHLFFQRGTLLDSELPLNERNSDVVAGVRSASTSSSSSLGFSLAKRGVCSVTLVECWERCDRDDRPDLWEDGRELGVVVEADGPSGVSMAAAGVNEITDKDPSIVTFAAGNEGYVQREGQSRWRRGEREMRLRRLAVVVVVVPGSRSVVKASSSCPLAGRWLARSGWQCPVAVEVIPRMDSAKSGLVSFQGWRQMQPQIFG